MRDGRRYLRQMRLAEVGESGQARIFASRVVAGSGLSGWVAARYLAGAGVGELSAGSQQVAAGARAMDDAVRVEVTPDCAPQFDERFEDLDPAARDVARGAHAAMKALALVLRA